MIETALIWLLTIFSLLIGYWIGSKTALTPPLEQLKSIIKSKVRPQKVGGIKRLTNNQIKKRGSKLEETENAMIDTFNKEMKDVSDES